MLREREGGGIPCTGEKIIIRAGGMVAPYSFSLITAIMLIRTTEK